MDISLCDWMTDQIIDKTYKHMILVIFLKFITELSLKIIKLKAYTPFMIILYLFIQFFKEKWFNFYDNWNEQN